MILLLLKATALFALALAVQPLLRRFSAALRHVICLAALCGALALPLSLAVPPRATAFRIVVPITASVARVAASSTGWRWSEIAVAIWLCGALFALARLAVGHLTLRRLLRDGERFGERNSIPVFLTDVSVPVLCGLIRPAILLPRDAGSWSDARLDAALRHELGHARRGDVWSLTAAYLSRALYWFHPLAWLLTERARQEQEEACDDLVLNSGLEPATYAEALVASARQLTSTRLIGCHMLTHTTLKTRIARLFDNGLARKTSRAGYLAAAVICLSTLAVTGMIAAQDNAAPQDGVYKVGNGVSAPSVVYKVDPEYTPEAHDAKVMGTVILSIVVGVDGAAHDINVLKGLEPGLSGKAVEAVSQWKFKPGLKDGEPVPVRANIEMHFQLK
ncbi:MAG TPA: M56 family metallopeptidase [Bryobacteraceae bacterium]|nr:M56 family metallopeptidase [Bryobacteraceae bacterium]